MLDSKLKNTSNWDNISTDFDLLGLIVSIKSVIFKLEDQRYLPLSLHYAKTNFYSFRKQHLRSTEYLEKFTNQVEISESFEGHLHDKALVDIVVRMSLDTKDVEWVDIPTNTQKELNSKAKKMYLSCAFISQADPRRYRQLKEELGNYFTKGSSTYFQDMVKTYQLLNEYKNWTPKHQMKESTGVAFLHTVSVDKKKDEWKQKKTCHHCGKKRHIRPDCPKIEQDLDKDDTVKPKHDKKSSRSEKKSIIRKKTVQFVATEDSGTE